MKREIKFRAWDTEKKGWKGMWIFRGGHVGEYDTSTTEIDILDLTDMWGENVVKMQYTGLKDKNGKEIYEGDILKIGHYIDDDCTIHEVEYCGHRDYPAFELKPDVGVDSNGLSWAIADATIFEVIGNIYENPELIKP